MSKNIYMRLLSLTPLADRHRRMRSDGVTMTPMYGSSTSVCRCRSAGIFSPFTPLSFSRVARPF